LIDDVISIYDVIDQQSSESFKTDYDASESHVLLLWPL